MNTFYGGFAALLESTLAASVVILLILVIQMVFRKAISARIRHLLWALVMIRLLVPIFPESTVSIFHVLDYGQTLQEQLWSSDVPANSDRAISNAAQLSVSLANPDKMEDTARFSPSLEQLHADSSENRRMNSQAYSLVFKVAAVVWLGGTIVLIMNLLIFLWRMARLRRQLNQVTEPSVLAILEEVRGSFKIARPIPLYTGPSNSSPFLFGLLRPWIFVPQSAIREMDRAQLSHILAHELAHYKRKDMLWSLLGSLAAAVHWMNPLIWISMRRMKADRELACDAYVLEKSGEEEAVAYGMTMISFLQRYSAAADRRGLLYFYNGRKELIRRFTMIQSFKKGSYRISVITVLLMTALGTVTLTNASGSTPPEPGINQPLKANEAILQPTGHRLYNSLDRAMRKAGFDFEAPVLPAGTKFREASLSGIVLGNGAERFDKVILSFGPDDNNHNSYGFFSITASNLKYTESHNRLIQNLKHNLIKPNAKYKSALEEIDHVVAEMNVHELYQIIDYGTHSSAYSYLFWQHDGISYRLDLNGDLTAQEKQTKLHLLISSMKLPDENMRKTYIDENSLTVDVVDSEDLQAAADAMGIAPKLPLEAAGFSLKHAFVTSKINFSYPRNKKEEATRVLYSEYESAISNDKKDSPRVGFYQMKDDGQFASFKANKQAMFFRMDGTASKVPAELITIQGKEVLRTSPYKTDGSLSTSLDPVWITCFWVDKGVVYRLSYKENQVKDPEAVMAALMKAQPVKFD